MSVSEIGKSARHLAEMGALATEKVEGWEQELKESLNQISGQQVRNTLTVLSAYEVAAEEFLAYVKRRRQRLLRLCNPKGS